MIKANEILDYPEWVKRIKNPKNYIKNRVKKLTKLNFFKNKKQEFSILLTNNKNMKKLNKKFMKRNKPTDVLSFPFNYKHEKNSYLGDIAISFQIVNKRSVKSSFLLEFDKMWVHGYFHLLGYDHKKLKDFKKMAKKENLILNYFHNIN